MIWKDGTTKKNTRKRTFVLFFQVWTRCISVRNHFKVEALSRLTKQQSRCTPYVLSGNEHTGDRERWGWGGEIGVVPREVIRTAGGENRLFGGQENGRARLTTACRRADTTLTGDRLTVLCASRHCQSCVQHPSRLTDRLAAGNPCCLVFARQTRGWW